MPISGPQIGVTLAPPNPPQIWKLGPTPNHMVNGYDPQSWFLLCDKWLKIEVPISLYWRPLAKYRNNTAYCWETNPNTILNNHGSLFIQLVTFITLPTLAFTDFHDDFSHLKMTIFLYLKYNKNTEKLSVFFEWKCWINSIVQFFTVQVCQMWNLTNSAEVLSNGTGELFINLMTLFWNHYTIDTKNEDFWNGKFASFFHPHPFKWLAFLTPSPTYQTFWALNLSLPLTSLHLQALNWQLAFRQVPYAS